MINADEILEAPERFKVVSAGRRSGKSKLIGRAAVEAATEGKAVWVIAATPNILNREYVAVGDSLPNGSVYPDITYEGKIALGQTVRLRFVSGGSIEFFFKRKRRRNVRWNLRLGDFSRSGAPNQRNMEDCQASLS